MAPTMASAVALPDELREAATLPSNGLKRRQSDVSEGKDNNDSNSKRQRTSTAEEQKSPTEDEQATAADKPSQTSRPAESPTTTTDPRDSRRKSGVADEKQRSKRLFGALLGNLNRTATNERASRRRNEIEARRKAELQKANEEREGDRAKRIEKLRQERLRKQVEVDEEDMHIRHRNLMLYAEMLQTQAEPRIYFRPWELLPDEEVRVEEQVREVKAVVEREVEAWEGEKRRRLRVLDGEEDGRESLRDDAERPKNTSTNGDEKQGSEHDQAKEGPAEGRKYQENTSDQSEQKGGAEAAENEQDRSQNGQLPDVEEKSHQGEQDETTVNGPEPEKRSGEFDMKYSGSQKDSSRPESEAREEAGAKTSAAEQEVKDDAEDEGDHVVEGDEDTVIY